MMMFRIQPAQGRVLAALVMCAMLIGCGEPEGPDIPIYIPDDVVDDAGADASDEGDEDTDSPDPGDAGDDDGGENDAGSDDTGEVEPSELELFYETFHQVAMTLPVGTTLRTPFELDELSTPVELMVVRELRGFNEVQNTENNRMVMTVNDAPFVGPETGWDREELPRGRYDAFLENLGGASGTDVNNYLAVKIASTPRMLASVAEHVGTIAEFSHLLRDGQGTGTTFEAREGHTYVLRGVRGMNTVFVINTDQLPLIESGEPFAYLYSWDEDDSELAPDPTVLDLPPGEFMVLVTNNVGDERHHGSVMLLDEFRLK